MTKLGNLKTFHQWDYDLLYLIKNLVWVGFSAPVPVYMFFTHELFFENLICQKNVKQF